MTSRVHLSIAILVLSVAVGGCRQPDGAMPTAGGDTPDRLEDLSRDLENVAGGAAQAREEFADDLRLFVQGKPAAVAPLDELSRRVSDVVAGKALNQQNAQRLAHHLWTTAAARDLSERQVETLQNDLHALLVSLGVPEANALNVAAQVAEVQVAVTDRQKRWYEFF
jgi:hypothetical protein